MSARDHYNEILDVLKRIEDTRIKAPHHTPVDTYIQEANDLYHWIQQDKEALTAAGLDWQLADRLPVRIGALIEAQARWTTEKNVKSDAAQTWQTRSTEGYALRSQLTAHFRFAFRKHPELVKKTRKTSKAHAGLIQDLNDLAVLADNLNHNEKALLHAIRFDFSLLDQARSLADELPGLYAAAQTGGPGYKEAKTIRDRAYTYLKEAVDEIRQTGQFVFRSDKNRFIGYRSHHLRGLNLKDKKNTPPAEEISRQADTETTDQWESWRPNHPQINPEVD